MKLTDKDAAALAKTQAEFEAWMATGNYPVGPEIALIKLPDGNYKMQATFTAWQGWQGAYNTKVRTLEGELKRVTDHLECFVQDHGEDRTADIDAAIFCSRQLLSN